MSITFINIGIQGCSSMNHGMKLVVLDHLISQTGWLFRDFEPSDSYSRLQETEDLANYNVWKHHA